MIKRILLLVIAAFSLGLSEVRSSQIELIGYENDAPKIQDITLTVDGGMVRINNAQGMTLSVVSLTGSTVTTVKIDTADKRVELNLPKGCYILKLGKVVRKISIR